MISFTAKKINDSQTVAEILSQARVEKKIDLNKVEKDTKINKKYLAALEKGEYNQLPSEIYIKNFVRSYTHYLGLNPEKLIKLLKQELEIFYKINESEQKENKEDLKPQKILITPKTIKYALVIFLIIACLIYLGWEINKIFSPPELIITNPQPDLITQENFVKIEGQTEPEVKITINDQEILADQAGYFEKQIDLQTGLNTIQIVAKKRFSREKVEIRQVLVKEVEE